MDTSFVKTQLITFESTKVYRFDDVTNQWVVEAQEPPVDETFNRWAEENRKRILFATVTTNQFVEGQSRYRIRRTLCATVISHDDWINMELSLRVQTAKLLGMAVEDPIGASNMVATVPPKIVDVSARKTDKATFTVLPE